MTDPRQSWEDRPAARALAVLLFVGVAAVLGGRLEGVLLIPDDPVTDRWGMKDFRDTVYFPVVALLDGHNPYDVAAYRSEYPVEQVFPYYSPLTLLVHLPFGLLPFKLALRAYFIFSLALTLVLAWAVLWACGARVNVTRVAGIAALCLLSRPGHMNLLLGQCTLQVVIPMLAALHLARRKPWLAGAALALVTIKPTFAVPLGFLMLCRGDFRAVFIGGTLGGLAALVPGVWVLANSGGLEGFLNAASNNYSGLTEHPGADPMTSWSRVDAWLIAARVLRGAQSGVVNLSVSAVCLLVAGAALIRNRRWNDPGAAGPAALLICLTTLICIYHQTYDTLLLSATLLALTVVSEPWRSVRRPFRWALVAAIAVPAANYVSTTTVLGKLALDGAAWTAVTCLNATAMIGAWLILLYWTMTVPPGGPGTQGATSSGTGPASRAPRGPETTPT